MNSKSIRLSASVQKPQAHLITFCFDYYFFLSLAVSEFRLIKAKVVALGNKSDLFPQSYFTGLPVEDAESWAASQKPLTRIYFSGILPIFLLYPLFQQIHPCHN